MQLLLGSLSDLGQVFGAQFKAQVTRTYLFCVGVSMVSDPKSFLKGPIKQKTVMMCEQNTLILQYSW